ncbi:uncharacterized protein BO87DRAFT_374373 [Aspergillus neoniger CBS 115656]|uniref:Uncharacterized protein n=1 Tax=Aspergillus neoniger (strain CBS 115656) TaxID=1448310 RepID=A0A318YQM2_ASPNB|nr:hypothetical protein BO87DRAFT_374373 [Aspergillus neoniger CBS 115656]PYH36689.1 hypothetical protein BO87DRAFT_374373 [Aspergillus neoniger CBS 115656]
MKWGAQLMLFTTSSCTRRMLEGYSADCHAVRGSSNIICRMMQPGSESLTLDSS